MRIDFSTVWRFQNFCKRGCSTSTVHPCKVQLLLAADEWCEAHIHFNVWKRRFPPLLKNARTRVSSDGGLSHACKVINSSSVWSLVAALMRLAICLRKCVFQ